MTIELKNVSKSYKLYSSPRLRLREALSFQRRKFHNEFYALREISLSIRPGEVLGVVGRNGSGKSTLLKLIAGIIKPTSGQVKAPGRISALLELGGGFNPNFTGLENIDFYAAIHGINPGDLDTRRAQIVEFADLGEFIHQPLKTYSTGMKARLGFAVGVHIDPDILIVDEVLAVGDILFRRKCYKKINELFSGGKTVMFVSHDTQSVIQFCTRAILLQDNRIVADGTPENIIKAYTKSLFEKNLGQRNQYVEPAKRDTTNEQSNNSEASSDYFSKDLVVEPFGINSHVGEVISVMLLDESGAEVNILRRGKTYRLEFNLRLNMELADVCFGAQLKRLDGLIITAGNTRDYQNQIVKLVEAHEVYVVGWTFKCQIVPGTYTFTVFASPPDDAQALIQEDALAFKVQQSTGHHAGLVNLEQNIVVTKCNGKSNLLENMET